MFSAIKRTLLLMLVLWTSSMFGGEPALSPKKKAIDPKTTCKRLYAKFAVPLKDLWTKRASDLLAENTEGYSIIADMPAEYCDDTNTRRTFQHLLAKIINDHTNKIGIILPLTTHSELKYVVAGIEARVREKGLDPSKVLVIKDTQGKDVKLEQAVASLIFEHKVSVLVGGDDSGDATLLRKWGQALLVPTFILAEPGVESGTDHEGKATNSLTVSNSLSAPNIFYAHPTQQSLAEAAVAANVRFAHRRISILSPTDQHSDLFIAAYKTAATAAGLTITHHVPYDSKRFESMESAAKKLFRLDNSDRHDELKKLYDTARQRAKETGEPFNSKMVALQPDIQQDAILIPDNFKIVRHFAKILAYLGVHKMPLFGHFEWRSFGLIAPWDNFLNGSYFVDFQGLYTQLPDPIKVSTSQNSPYFVDPDKIEQADFSLVGWHAAEAPIFLISKKIPIRRRLAALVPHKSDDDSLLPYDHNNVIQWPLHLFSIATGPTTNSGAGSISMLSP